MKIRFYGRTTLVQRLRVRLAVHRLHRVIHAYGAEAVITQLERLAPKHHCTVRRIER